MYQCQLLTLLVMASQKKTMKLESHIFVTISTLTKSNEMFCKIQNIEFSQISNDIVAGPSEDGLPGPGGAAGDGLCAADHSGGAGWPVARAGREAGQGVPAADGRLRGSAQG